MQTYELTPEEEGGVPDTQAGSHPFQLTTTRSSTPRRCRLNQTITESILQKYGPMAMTKDLRLTSPGLIGNPTPIPKCSLRVFIESTTDGAVKCPDNTAVGVATPILTGPSDDQASYTTSEPLFSLEPAVGEPARFGFNTLVGPVILDTSVRTGSDYGVVVTVPDITEGTGFIGNIVTFWGVPADAQHNNSRGITCIQEAGAREHGEGESLLELHPGPEPSCPVKEKAQPLLITPTSCTGPLHSTVEADSGLKQGSSQNHSDTPSRIARANRAARMAATG